MSAHRILIVGGGAGGLELATALGRKLGRRGRAEITLVDAVRAHVWKPKLHEIAAGSMDIDKHDVSYLAHAHWHGFGFRLDPTRLVEDNSPCHYNHVESDINSWHFYINDYHRVRQHVQRVVDETFPGSSFNYVGKNDAGDNFVQTTAPLMNSEYGGIAARSGDQDIAWCFKYQTTEQRRHAKICGYIYTELDDIEWEHNGFVNYDRSAKEFGYDFFVEGMSVADLNAADFVGLDAPPCQTLAPGSNFSAPLFVSHWGLPMGSGKVRWQLNFTNRFGQRSTPQSGEVAISPQRFSVSDLGALSIPLPAENGLATVALWLEDEQGTI